MNAIDKLKELRKLLEDPSRWVRRAGALDASRKPVDTTSHHAVCWCVVGGVQKVATSRLIYLEMIQKLARPLYASDQKVEQLDPLDLEIKIIHWNDSRIREHAEVLEHIDKVIANG